MIAALMRGASFGAEWAGVCTALFVRPRMPWPQVRQGSDGVGLPPIKGCARRHRLAPTIQSAGEAFQGGALDDVGSEKRSSYWGYATAKGRSQPPCMGDKPEAERTPAFALAGDTCGPNKEEGLGRLPVTRSELAPRDGLDVCPLNRGI